ncbi:ABC transporter permease subunit [Pelagibacterium halotolerans]|nr:ABC transporter permease subunit [Pelagibacterium halotolerans]
MSFSILPTDRTDPYWWYLLVGLANTLFLAVIGLAGATIFGGLVGLALIAPNRPLNLIGTIYVEIFRNIPLILQIFFWYSLTTLLPSPRNAGALAGVFFTGRGIYLPGLNVAGWSIALFWVVIFATVMAFVWFMAAKRFRKLEPGQRRRIPVAIIAVGLALAAIVLFLGHPAGTPWLAIPEPQGLNIRGGYRIQPELYALAFAIAVAGGASVAEIFRGGFKAVGSGHAEAAYALGLSGWQTFSRVRFPLAMRAMLPSLSNQFVWLVKATTLGLIVGYTDLFAVVVSSITQSGQTFEFMAILMVAFILINFSLANVFNRINDAARLKGHQTRG